MLGRLHEGRVPHPPLMRFAACRTDRTNRLFANAQERADLARNPAVDRSPSMRANEYEMFHCRAPRPISGTPQGDFAMTRRA